MGVDALIAWEKQLESNGHKENIIEEGSKMAMQLRDLIFGDSQFGSGSQVTHLDNEILYFRMLRT